MQASTAVPGDPLEAAFALIAERGWCRFRLGELATRLDMPLSQMRATFALPEAVIVALGRRLDGAMLAFPADELAGLEPRERLFELVMRRLDAAAPFAAGLRRLAREAPGDPRALCATAANLDRMAGWMIDVAGVRVPPLASGLARAALVLLYARVLDVWLGDGTADRSRTMAELDKRLGHLGQACAFASRLGRGRQPAGPPEAA